MKSLYEIQRVRYPPFEASRWIPEALPVATKRIHLGDFATEDDVLAAHGEHGPAFMIGKEDAWLLERHYEYGGEVFQLGESQGRVERDPFVPLVKDNVEAGTSFQTQFTTSYVHSFVPLSWCCWPVCSISLSPHSCCS